MISRAFFKSSLIFTAGGALPMLASVLLLPFYTNYLSEVNYVRLLFYINVSAISQVLFSFSTDTYFGIRFSQLFDKPQLQKEFISTTSRLLIVSGAGLLLLLSFAGPWIFDIIFRKDLGMSFWPYGFLSILTGYFNSYFKTASICLIYLRRPGRFLADNALNFLLTVVISIGGLYCFPGSLIGPIAGRVISGAVIFLLGAKTFAAHGSRSYNREFIPDMVQFCLPYLVYGISIWLLAQVDRYILQSHVSLEQLSAYDLVLKCLIGIEFLQNSLSAVIFPKVYEIWARNGKMETTTESNRYFNAFTVVNIFQLIVFCLCLPMLYDLLIRKAYFFEGEKLLSILSACYALRSIVSFYLAGLLYSKNSRLMLVIFGISSVVQIISSAVVIRKWGIEGAVYAMLITRAAQCVLFALIAPTVFTYSFNKFKIIVLPVLYVISGVVFYAVYHSYSAIFFFGQLVVFVVLAGLMFRNELLTTFGTLAKRRS